MMRIRVPGTSANLGPGFDSLGLALAVYNWYEVGRCTGRGASRIEGCPEELAGEDNLFLVAFRRGLEDLGLPSFPIRVGIESQIPIARGLGSSAACIVGGLIAASILGGEALGRAEGLTKARILDLATSLEGHPDNVAPAIYGGFRVSAWDGLKTWSLGCPLGREPGRALDFYALVPPFSLETKVARAALPKEVVLGDAVFNLGRASLMTASFMSGDWSCLPAALEDRLHQARRAPLIPGYYEVVAAAKKAGAVGGYLSGAGPTVMVLGLPEGPGSGQGGDGLADRLQAVAASQEPGAWTCLALAADDEGAIVEG